MTFDEITAERRRLYAEGGIVLRRVILTGAAAVTRAFPVNELDEAAWQRAARYNWLAARHQQMALAEIA